MMMTRLMKRKMLSAEGKSPSEHEPEITPTKRRSPRKARDTTPASSASQSLSISNEEKTSPKVEDSKTLTRKVMDVLLPEVETETTPMETETTLVETDRTLTAKDLFLLPDSTSALVDEALSGKVKDEVKSATATKPLSEAPSVDSTSSISEQNLKEPKAEKDQKLEDLEKKEEILKETSEVTPVVTNEVTSEVTSVVSPETTSEVTSVITPEVTAETTFKVTAEATSEVTPVATPETTFEVTPETTSEVTPETTFEVTAETTSEVTPVATPETTFEVTVEATSEVTPVATPETTFEVTAETTSEVTPVATPETTSEVTPVVTPETTSEVGQGADDAGQENLPDSLENPLPSEETHEILETSQEVSLGSEETLGEGLAREIPKQSQDVARQAVLDEETMQGYPSGDSETPPKMV